MSYKLYKHLIKSNYANVKKKTDDFKKIKKSKDDSREQD